MQYSNIIVNCVACLNGKRAVWYVSHVNNDRIKHEIWDKATNYKLPVSCPGETTKSMWVGSYYYFHKYYFMLFQYYKVSKPMCNKLYKVMNLVSLKLIFFYFTFYFLLMQSLHWGKYSLSLTFCKFSESQCTHYLDSQRSCTTFLLDLHIDGSWYKINII